MSTLTTGLAIGAAMEVADLLLAGCGLQGASGVPTYGEIMIAILLDIFGSKTSGGPVVDGARVACSAMVEAESQSHMIKEGGGITLQGGVELNHKDINFEPFSGCSKKNGKCLPDIEDEEWKDYDETSQIDGKYGLLKERSYMICTYGEGIVYLSDNGQRSPNPGDTPTSASDNLISFLANYEKFYDMPYRGLDSQNRTVGYGHVILEGEGTKYDNGITEKEARELLKNDLKSVVYDYLNPWIEKNSVVLNQQQYDALVSFTFNAGPAWITEYKDLRNILMSGNITYEAMYTEFMDWIKVNGEPTLGLYRRRMDELNIFFNEDYSRNYPNWP